MGIARLKQAVGTGAMMAAALTMGAGLANASPITFTFNSVVLNQYNVNSSGSHDAGSDANVQTYMNSMLAGVGSVVVTGAQADTKYNGDGHVVGPVNGSTVTSNTLGTDTFIDTFASTDILMQFKTPTNTPLKIYSVTFDYEIFPNGDCTSLDTSRQWNWSTFSYQNVYSDCGGGTSPTDLPDFTFKADGTTYLHSTAVSPGAPADPLTHSPNSGKNNTEEAPQLGPQTVTFTFANGVSTLDFVDWPATIGIDNLIIDTTPPDQTTDTPTVPEPGSMMLLGSGLAGLVARYRRTRAQ